MRLVDISTRLYANTTTTLRFLNSLQNCGYVIQDPDTSRYQLSYKICKISDTFLRRTDIRSITHPFLLKLTQRFQESACLSIEQNDSMVYVDVAPGPDKALMSFQQVGNVSPMHCTGNGKLLLLNYSEEQLDSLIAKKGLAKYTENTLTTKAALIRELNKIRRYGFAYDNEECEKGLRCIAAPIYNYTGNIYAGVSITGPAIRMTDDFLGEKRHYLKEAADAISEKLGYTFKKQD